MIGAVLIQARESVVYHWQNGYSMTTTGDGVTANPQGENPTVVPASYSPLLPSDPPKVGDYWLDARADATPAGIVYTAHDDQDQVLLLLLSAGAADDPVARDRFSGAINELHIDTVIARGGDGQDQGRLGHRFQDEEDDPVEPDHLPLAPWAALANDGSVAAVAEGHRILTVVDMSQLPPKGTPKGPDFALPWITKTEPGRWRLWPLPWPGRYDRAGWVTIAVSWLLMMAIAAVAVVLAIILFKNVPTPPPPPPVPTTAQSPQSASPTSGSPTQSASPQSASPTPSDGTATGGAKRRKL